MTHTLFLLNFTSYLNNYVLYLHNWHTSKHMIYTLHKWCLTSKRRKESTLIHRLSTPPSVIEYTSLKFKYCCINQTWRYFDWFIPLNQNTDTLYFNWSTPMLRLYYTNFHDCYSSFVNMILPFVFGEVRLSEWKITLNE